MPVAELVDIEVKDIIERAKAQLGVSSDRELSEVINVEYQTVISWKKRNSIPLGSLVSIAKQAGLLVDWLLFGDRFISPRGIGPEIDPEILKIAVRTACRRGGIESSKANRLEDDVISNYILFSNMMKSLIQKGRERHSAIKTVETTAEDIARAFE